MDVADRAAGAGRRPSSRRARSWTRSIEQMRTTWASQNRYIEHRAARLPARQLARRRHQRAASGAADPDGGRGGRAADHVREPGRAAARARLGAPARDCHPLSMGAGRWRIVQQLLVEGDGARRPWHRRGTGRAAVDLGLLIGFAPPSELPIHLDVPVDARVLWFTAAVAIGTVLLFALAPAAQAAPVERGHDAARVGRRRPRLRPSPAAPRPRGRAGRAVDRAARWRGPLHAKPQRRRADDARVPGRRRRRRLARLVLGRLHRRGGPRVLRARARTRPRAARRRIRRRSAGAFRSASWAAASATSRSRATPPATAIRRASASTTSAPTTRRRCRFRSSPAGTCRRTTSPSGRAWRSISETMARDLLEGSRSDRRPLHVRAACGRTRRRSGSRSSA